MTPHLVKGALLLLLAEACFAGIGAIVKFTSATATEAQVVFFRNFFALLLMLPFLFKHGFSLLKTKRWYLHASRALTGIISMYCFFYVLARLPLAQGMLVLLLSPFVVPIIARFWLKERPSRITLAGIVLGFVGVVLALPTPDPNLNLILLVALVSAILVAVTKTTIRYMSDTEPAVRIVFYFSLLTAVLSAIPVPFYWQPLNSGVWLAFLGMGVLAAIGQLFWQEPVTMSWAAGVLVIFYAGYITTRQRLL
ncbi:MAG: multidrug DMT transporter permease [Alishewanella sp. 34-51-39]|nr:MAG: multidrug DMT transporter permease [Alishewanella sp. 34-51-39]